SPAAPATIANRRSWTREPLRTLLTNLLHATCTRRGEPKRAARSFSPRTPNRAGRRRRRHEMGLGVGIFLIAVGAILTFAVNATTSGVNIDAVGWILMGVGLVSILLSLLFWQSWAGPGYWTGR